jgi:hypothetical protein
MASESGSAAVGLRQIQGDAEPVKPALRMGMGDAAQREIKQLRAWCRTVVKRIAVTVAATTVVTAQLWDFGVPADTADWPRPAALWSK